MSINSTAQRVILVRQHFRLGEYFLKAVDDPNGTHMLVPVETWERVVRLLPDGIEAFRFTREYVGETMLPEINGWSWFDWCQDAHRALAEIGGEDGGDTDNKSTSIDHNGGAGR